MRFGTAPAGYKSGIVAFAPLRFGIEAAKLESLFHEAALTVANVRRYSARKYQVAPGEDDMDPRYPIGDFAMPAQVSPARRQQAIQEIAAAPWQMRAPSKALSAQQLEPPY